MKLNMYFIDARISAIDFYEKLGFEVVSEVFASKKTGAPHVRMERRDRKWIKNI
jgi:predicted GNAT family N-acyltransferase